MKHTLLSLLAAVTTATATTIPFETVTDLTDYTSVVTSNSTLAQLPSIGADSTGGVSYKGDTGSSDRSFVAYRTLAQTGNTWTTSILINPSNFDTLNKDKVELRLGFATSTTTSTSKPHEFFHKLNPSISMRLTAEHENVAGKMHMLKALLTNRVATDTNTTEATTSSSTHFNSWLRASLTIVQTGTDTFNASYTIESLGATGTDPATPVLSAGPFAMTNATFAAATTFYPGFTLKTEKLIATEAFLDDHTFTIATLPPGTPTAVAATAVSATSLTANWQAPAGLPAANYLVELSTAANNFAPNTLIAADGTAGQATGVTVGNVNALVFDNLTPNTTYRYRVTASNSSGSSPVSNTFDATTLLSGINYPPTLDPVSDQGPIATLINPILIPLTHLTTGGEHDQTVTVTVTPADTSIIASGSVSAPNVAGNATLTLIPTGTEGTTLITLLVDDGAASNNTISRSFTVKVRNPLETLTFATATDLDELNLANATTVSQQFFSNAGTGNPATGGVLASSTTIGSAVGFAGWRKQQNLTTGATFYRTSLAINAANLDDIASDKEAKLEISLGYSPTTNLNASKPEEFLNKTNHSIHAKFKFEHKPSDAGKLRKIEVELSSATAAGETKVGKLNVNNSPAVNDWLLLSLDLAPDGGDNFIASWKVESLGEFGTDAPVIVLQSTPFTLSNPSLAAATGLHAAYTGKFDKEINSVRLDDHRSFVSRSAPDAPITLAANLVTATGFNANWQLGSSVPAASFVLEVVPDGSPFTTGNFIAADGTPAQTAGISITDGQLRTLRIENLTGGTTYQYRVLAANVNGSSPASNAVSLTTLPPGINSPPTLSAIATPPPIAINAAAQTINLSGITAGGEPGQTLTVTAVSSNTALIPDPTVTYTSPNTTGSLDFTPITGAVGNSTITVTVNDGAPNNNITTRTFKITVVDPNPLLDFNDVADFDALAVSPIASTLVHSTANGIANTGSLAFNGVTLGADRVAVIVRPTAFDASSAVHLVTSMDFKAADVFNTTTGKDKGELRLGFMGQNTPNAAKPQDTLNKTHPSLALRFKLEHEPAAADKQRLLEAEVVSWTGTTELKDIKLTLSNFYTDDNWLRVTLTAVRTGTSTATVSYTVDDMGPDGTTFVSRVLESGTFTLSNAAFFADNSVFAAATISDEKNSVSNLTLRADNYFAEVNTTAPTAPATQQVSAITVDGFTANWTPALDGNFPDGFLVEIVPNGMPFLPGNFLSATGTPGQATGISVNDSFAENLSVSGLNSSTTYRVRVRAFSNSASVSESLALNSVFATTLAPPGLEYPDWRTQVFGANAANEAIAGPNAINNSAGINNLLAYAFGLDPFAPDLSLLPQVDTTGEFLRITYRRRFNVTGITVTPTISSNLTGFGSAEVVIVSTSAPVAGFVTVTAEDQFPIINNPKRFMRVEVTTP